MANVSFPRTWLFCLATIDGSLAGGEPRDVPKDRDILYIARKAKYGAKQAAPGNYRTLRLSIVLFEDC
jgi:hypothetical protein